jgi:hypothetical protein
MLADNERWSWLFVQGIRIEKASLSNRGFLALSSVEFAMCVAAEESLTESLGRGALRSRSAGCANVIFKDFT